MEVVQSPARTPLAYTLHPAPYSLPPPCRCGQHMAPCMDLLLQLYHRMLLAGAAAQLPSGAGAAPTSVLEEDVQHVCEGGVGGHTMCRWDSVVVVGHTCGWGGGGGGVTVCMLGGGGGAHRVCVGGGAGGPRSVWGWGHTASVCLVGSWWVGSGEVWCTAFMCGLWPMQGGGRGGGRLSH